MEPSSLKSWLGAGQYRPRLRIGSRGVFWPTLFVSGRSQEDPPALYFFWIGGGTSSPRQRDDDIAGTAAEYPRCRVATNAPKVRQMLHRHVAPIADHQARLFRQLYGVGHRI